MADALRHVVVHPPQRFSAWSTVFAQFSRWKKKGVWEKVLAVLQYESGLHKWLVDSTTVRTQPTQTGAEVVILSKNNRKQVLDHERKVCRRSNQIERCINRLKAYRGLAIRFKKTASAYLALVMLAAVRMWL